MCSTFKTGWRRASPALSSPILLAMLCDIEGHAEPGAAAHDLFKADHADRHSGQ
jgi:hypothetical protein